MKKLVKLETIRRIVGIAVMVTAIVFGMTACGDDGNGGGGNTVTFILTGDEADFSVIVQGANWKQSARDDIEDILVISEGARYKDPGNSDGYPWTEGFGPFRENPYMMSSTSLAFYAARSSGYQAKGTISLPSDVSKLKILTDGPDSATYKLHSSQTSVTFNHF